MEAHQQHTLPQGLCQTGKVVMISDDNYVVASHVTLKAQRALSCHLLPEVGDEVLIAETDEQAYILAVLKREQKIKQVYAYPGHSIFKMEGLCLQEAKHIQITTDSYRLETQHQFTQADRVDTQAQSIHTQADLIETQAECMVTRTDRLYQWVKGFEQRCSQKLRLIVQNLFRVDAKASVLASKEDIKVRARQIHLG